MSSPRSSTPKSGSPRSSTPKSGSPISSTPKSRSGSPRSDKETDPYNNITDKRIIDLRKPFEQIAEELPEWFDEFKSKPEVNMILSAGDGLGLNGNKDGRSDVEFFTSSDNYKDERIFDIFACMYEYNTNGFKKSVGYLKRNPKLKVILFLFDDKDLEQMGKLITLLESSVSYLTTDDTRSFIPAMIAYNIVKSGGIIDGIRINAPQSTIPHLNTMPHLKSYQDNIGELFERVTPKSEVLVRKGGKKSKTKRRNYKKRKSRKNI